MHAGGLPPPVTETSITASGQAHHQTIYTQILLYIYTFIKQNQQHSNIIRCSFCGSWRAVQRPRFFEKGQVRRRREIPKRIYIYIYIYSLHVLRLDLVVQPSINQRHTKMKKKREKNIYFCRNQRQRFAPTCQEITPKNQLIF